MDTLGIHHLGLAVSNPKATTRFFTDCFGWSIARTENDPPHEGPRHE